MERRAGGRAWWRRARVECRQAEHRAAVRRTAKGCSATPAACARRRGRCWPGSRTPSGPDASRGSCPSPTIPGGSSIRPSWSRFFAHPARFFLRHRLGVRLEVEDATLDEEEPFELDGLERYQLRSEVWSRMRAGAAPERTEALMSGRGRLPQAGLGRVVHEREWQEAQQLEKQLAPYRAALDAPPREVDFEIDGFRVVGALERIGPDGTMVWPRLGRLRARDRIEIWLRQLVWAAAGNRPVDAVGISRERKEKRYSWKSEPFPAPERAGEQIERWLRAWWRGLAAPLPLLPGDLVRLRPRDRTAWKSRRRGRAGGGPGQGYGQVDRERPPVGGRGRSLSPPRPRRRASAHLRVRGPRGRASRTPHRSARGRSGTRR